MIKMQPFFGLRGHSLSRAIGVVAGLCFFLYGFDQGDMGGFLTIDSFLGQFSAINFKEKPITTTLANLTGFTVASWNLGCFVSAVVAIFIGDLLGRKKMIYTGLTLLLIGEVIQCASFAWGQFVVGRLIAGLGCGLNCSAVPAWQAECTKAHRRGTLLMISAGVCIAAGLSFAYWVDFAFGWLGAHDTAAWRAPIAMQIILIFIALGLAWFMPESPRWLILQGREGEASHVLAALNDLPQDHKDIRMEFMQIKDAVIEMMNANFKNVFEMGDYRHLHRVVLAVMLQFFQQIGGINFVTQYFAQMFLFQYKWEAWESRLLAACASSTFFLFSFVSVFSIDRICGRRPLLLFGTSGMLVCMIVLTIMLWINSRESLNVGTAFLFLFGSFYAVGWQGMSWLYQVEIVPLRIRGPANAMSTASNWLANFIVVMISPVAFVDVTYRTYIIFVATNAVILPTIYFLYPETSKRCLEEIDYIFHTANSSPHPWLDVKRLAADEPLWYDVDTEQVFDYEGSDWHQKHVRFSDDAKGSEVVSTTLLGFSDDEKFKSDSSRSGSDVVEITMPPHSVLSREV